MFSAPSSCCLSGSGPGEGLREQVVYAPRSPPPASRRRLLEIGGILEFGIERSSSHKALSPLTEASVTVLIAELDFFPATRPGSTFSLIQPFGLGVITAP